VLTAPITAATGTWRWGLGSWALVALAACLPWLRLIRHDDRLQRGSGRVRLRQIARTRLGRAMALVFGLQSLHAYAVFGWLAEVYRDAGLPAASAGLLLGVVKATGIPMSLLTPFLAIRRPDQTWLAFGILVCYPLGYLGLMTAPTLAPWLWALLLGVATGGIFPLTLTQIGLRCRTPNGTAALSAFSQSVGYALSALGPLGIGVLVDVTGSWTLPLGGMLALSLLLAAVAPTVARPRIVEHELQPPGQVSAQGELSIDHLIDEGMLEVEVRHD
jgi:CP family cyanate transporter-like MFS transporter